MPGNGSSESISWRFVLVVSGVAGGLFAALTISGWIHGWEKIVAPGILVALAMVVLIRNPKRPVLHGFLAGFLAGFVAVELQALFLPWYFVNNPEYALIEIPFGLSARLATAVFAPVHATLAGTLIAGMVWVVGRLAALKGTPA